MGPWILAAVGACTNGGPPLGPPGEPGESRLLGTEQWRVPQGAVGLGWRGEDLLVAAKEVLVTVGADGLPRRDRLPTRASTLAVRGEDVVIGTSDGDLMRVGDRLRLDGDPGQIVAVDIGPDGAAIAALNEAPRPAPPQGTHVRYPEVGRVALFAGDGRRLTSWTIERCRPMGLVHLGRNLLVGCGSYPAAVVDLGDSSVVRVSQLADRVSRSIDGAYAVTSGRDGYAVWRAGARRPERVVEEWGIGAVAVSATGEVAFARAGRVFTSGGELGGPASELAFSADGLELAGRSGSRLWRWDLGSGAVAEVEGHETRVGAVALSDDGRFAVSGSVDGEVCRWEVAAPSRPVRCWSWGGRAQIAAVAVTGTRVVGAAARTVRVYGERDWELPFAITALSTDGGELFARVREHWYRLEPDGAVVPVEPRESHEGPYGAFPMPAAAAAWSAAGFVTGHDDGTVRVWGIAP